jgi:hypothetical protein
MQPCVWLVGADRWARREQAAGRPVRTNSRVIQVDPEIMSSAPCFVALPDVIY